MKRTEVFFRKTKKNGRKIYESGWILAVLLFPLILLMLIQPVFCQSNDTMPFMNMGGEKHPAAPEQAKMDMGNGDMDIAHPFYTHMGIPDPVGHYALRLSGVATRDGNDTESDVGFHLETGLSKTIGLHIRNDRVSYNHHTEVAFQFAAIQSHDGMSGLSSFIEFELPTRAGDDRVYTLVGLSAALELRDFAFNQSVEYSPKEDTVEGSVSLVTKIRERFFPVIEFIWESAKDALPQASVLSGLKCRFSRNIIAGIGYKVPVSSAKEFDGQFILQTDIEW